MDKSQVEDKVASQTTDVQKIHPKYEPKRYSEIFRDFDNLDLSLISCAEEDLLADTNTQPTRESDSAECKEQHDACCEASLFPLKRAEANEADGSQSAQEADLALCRCDDGVETALQYTKMWCRYAKDLLAWMEKRISLEQEFAKNVIKTAEGAKTNVGHQEMMPLQYIYTMALEQDIKNSVTSKKTAELLQNRCYQALVSKKNEIDKWRREFKEQWAREQRRMNESVTSMKKARQQYFQRCDELEKAKAISAKTVEDTAAFKTLDKRRKCKDEAQAKVLEVELQYRQCLNDAKIQQNELVKVKERIICHIRKLICQGDSVLKEATVNMFYYQRQQTEPVPLGYHNLEMTCRSLEPGEPYLFYILSKHRPERPLPVFTFQEYVPPGKGNKRKTSNTFGFSQEPLTDDNAYGHLSDGKKKGHSDSESIGGSLESLSSPAHTTKRLPKPASTLTISSDDLDDRDGPSESECIDNQLVKARMLSRAVLTHQLKKMKSKMVKCKQCDNYIVVSGIECEQCGLALHRKCMESCQLECEHRKGTVFGVDLSAITRDKRDDVPFVVLQCTSEIEHRALSVQGVYRVSGSKPRIQKLCQAFEVQKEKVDLSEYSPHDITSILKQFFKELPEPLLTFDLYNGFVTVGKNIQHQNEREPHLDTNEVMEIIHNLQDLLQKLPSYCYSTLQHLIAHLQKVSENDDNKMSPSNLGIVFGPTLLRPLVSTDMSLMALLETSYQAALVEFLIIHHDRIFGPQQISCTPPPPAPKAPLPDTPPRASCPLKGEVNSEHESSSRECPLSVENRTSKRESVEGCISNKSSWNDTVDQLGSDTRERAVLAMRGPLCSAQDDPEEEPIVDMGTQTHYRFTRQPVKYYRHHNPRTRPHNPGYSSRQLEAPTRGSLESADDSLSSSPEAPSQTPSHHLCTQSDKTSMDIAASGHRADAPLSPREVVQYMLGLDSTFTSAASETSSYTNWDSPLEETDECRADRTMTRPLSQATKTFPTDNIPSSPAHKILSGLKLRRSHSGKDEQLFV